MASDLDPLSHAYDQGNFALVRRLAKQRLADPAGEEAARAVAKTWLERVSVDVAVYATLGFALLLFCAIVLRYG